ncbi:hypothetical protein BU204_27775 [Actinophytocola xanthii]|uniref:M23ase beta-sheet core domain-containing protein n=1 Tax=Actinophytocola xanthii TaxID=1912961 RepID=A0A1Q8CG75_9PSEU|nr:hypothetical protein BU204_27775 [Actinophytocola xanthii]
MATITRPWTPAGTPPPALSAYQPPSHAPPVPPTDPHADAGASASRFVWPLPPPHPVLRPFQAPSSPYGPGHRGVDLGGPIGAPVMAAAAGVVVFAGEVAGRGVVSVDHVNGLRTTYQPVDTVVTRGQRLPAGALLGHLLPGHLGCSGAPACLHWGVRRGAEYLDPLALLSRAGVRLLPWKEDH